MLFAWKRRMTEGGTVAVAVDEDVVGSSRVRELERQVRDLERLLGRKTMEVELRPQTRRPKASDDGPLALIRPIVDARPSYDYGRITALVDRKLVAALDR
jgi:transposase